jgi:hypothetical protein
MPANTVDQVSQVSAEGESKEHRNLHVPFAMLAKTSCSWTGTSLALLYILEINLSESLASSMQMGYRFSKACARLDTGYSVSVLLTKELAKCAVYMETKRRRTKSHTNVKIRPANVCGWCHLPPPHSSAVYVMDRHTFCQLVGYENS